MRKKVAVFTIPDCSTPQASLKRESWPKNPLNYSNNFSRKGVRKISDPCKIRLRV
jgi:hypothetical protein